VLRDYWALLGFGWRFAATGSSDSHRIQFHWAGYPRTMVTVDPDATPDKEARPVDPLTVVANVKKGHAVVTSGPIIEFVLAGAQDIPSAPDRFDLALMLKSLHHVPGPLMGTALREARRVLKPGGSLYVSEPVFAGALNEVIRLFHDEQAVRQAAQDALRAALQAGDWELVAHTCFDTPVAFRDFADFEQRIVHATFADHRLDEATRAQVRRAFEAHLGPGGARFLRPMRVHLLRKPLA